MKPVPVVAAILLNARNEVLMQLRDDKPGLLFPDHWTVPGGHIEGDESPDDAIRRELREEMELELPLSFWKVHEAPRADYVVRETVYVGHIDRPAGDIPLHEGQALRFMSRDEIRQVPVAFGHQTLLEEFFVEKWSNT